MGIYEELVARGLIAQVTNEEEIDFRTNILDNLGELEIVDGAIVPKAE